MSVLYVDTINEKTSGNGIYVPGHVLQVVNTVTEDLFTHTNTSSVWSSNISILATSITPLSTSSKILITGAITYATNNSTYGAMARMRCLRDSTVIGDESFFARSAGYDAADDASSQGSFTCTYLDSPSTTSQVTYNFQIKQNISSGTNIAAYVNGTQGGGNTGQSMITLMEIGG